MALLYVAAALAAAAAIYLFLLAPGRRSAFSDALWKADYAHRGIYRKDQSVPENSLAAFSEAAAAGYGIELDVTVTTDGRVVVFHDDSLLRACGVDRDIRGCSYGELRACRLFGTDEGIPLFSETLALVDGRAPLIVELKHKKQYRGLCEKTAALLDAYNGPYCIESFDPRIVRWFRKNRPHVVRGQLAAGVGSYETTPYYQSLLMSALMTNVWTRPHFVAYRHQDARHKLGLHLYKRLGGALVAWTVHKEDIACCRRLFDTVIFEFFLP